MQLKILTQNCWGIPYISFYRKERFTSIGKELASGKYDVVALQEVWSNEDYKALCQWSEDALPYCHYFYSGVIGSGLCIFSRWPIVNTLMHTFSLNGRAHKVWHGDWFGGKCLALSIIQLPQNRLLYFYFTHTIANYDANLNPIGLSECDPLPLETIDTTATIHWLKVYESSCDIYAIHRLVQAFEIANFIRVTFNIPLPVGFDKNSLLHQPSIILAGDLNSQPWELPIRLIKEMTGLQDTFNNNNQNNYHHSNVSSNLINEKPFLHSTDSSTNHSDELRLSKSWSTFLHPSNSFTGHNDKYSQRIFDRIKGQYLTRVFLSFFNPRSVSNTNSSVQRGEQFGQILDYIMYHPNDLVCTDCHILDTKFCYEHDTKGKNISLSDHEGVIATFHTLDVDQSSTHLNNKVNSPTKSDNKMPYLHATDQILCRAMERTDQETLHYKCWGLGLLVLLLLTFVYEDCIFWILSHVFLHQLNRTACNITLMIVRLNLYAVICYHVWMAIVSYRTEINALRNTRETIRLIKQNFEN